MEKTTNASSENVRVNKNSKARIDANNRYFKKTYDKVTVVLKKGEKEQLKALAEQNGESLNALIVRAIEKMKRESIRSNGNETET